jgi:DNA-binding transcriptional LysR family regulator
LIAVLRDHPIAQTTLYLVYVSRRNAPLKIRTFIDFFLETVAREAEPAPAAVA